MRLLFSSIHCYLDPSSGAALCTRESLELLAERGMDCRVLTTGILDPKRETSLDEVFATLELPVRRFQAELGMGGAAEVIDLGVNGVLATLMPTSSSRAERPPDPRVSAIFLELAEHGGGPGGGDRSGFQLRKPEAGPDPAKPSQRMALILSLPPLVLG